MISYHRRNISTSTVNSRLCSNCTKIRKFIWPFILLVVFDLSMTENSSQQDQQLPFYYQATIASSETSSRSPISPFFLPTSRPLYIRAVLSNRLLRSYISLRKMPPTMEPDRDSKEAFVTSTVEHGITPTALYSWRVRLSNWPFCRINSDLL